MKHTIATLTNIFYGLAGVAVYQHDPTLWPLSITLAVLMLGSGYHHYHLQSWSRPADFVGMYLTLSSIALLPFIRGWPLFITSVVIAGLLYLLFQSNVNVILGLIGVVLISLLYATGWSLAPMLEVTAFAAIAVVFNYTGDNVHSDHHDLIHGIGWHIPTAYALYLTVTYII